MSFSPKWFEIKLICQWFPKQLDSSFSDAQFYLKSYSKHYRTDRNSIQYNKHSDKRAYNKQINKCIMLSRKTKVAYYWNLSMRNRVDNQNISKTKKKVFSVINQTILKIYLLLKTASCLLMIVKFWKLLVNIFKT